MAAIEEERLFRRIVKENDLLTPEQLSRCEKIQQAESVGKSRVKPLVIVCIEQGLVDDKLLQEILELERGYLDDGADAKADLLFGEIAVERSFCSAEQLDQTFRAQRQAKGKRRRIGQVLVELGYLTPYQVSQILQVQGKRVGRCGACNAKFNISNFNAQRDYHCPRCSGDLVLVDSSVYEVERESLVSSLLSEVPETSGGFIGETIDGYKVIELLGEGGMAEVYKAYHTRLRRTRAIKVIKSDQNPQRFLREGQAASKIQHPNIIEIYEIGEHLDRAYFFMELIRGDTLKEWMQRVPIPFDDALELVRQITFGLAAAHEAGIVHRDVKPSNILVDRTADGIVAKLTDFGIAKGENQTSLTATGQIVGTMKYLSPEHIEGQLLDGRADIFSLGILSHELFTGREPWDVDSKLGYLFTNIKDAAPLLSSRDPSIPAGLDRIVSRMLEKTPQRRLDAVTLIDDLALLQDHLVNGTSLRNNTNPISTFYASASGRLLRRISGFFKREDLPEGSSDTHRLAASKSEHQILVEPDSTDLENARAEFEYARRLEQKGELVASQRCMSNLLKRLPDQEPLKADAQEYLKRLQRRLGELANSELRELTQSPSERDLTEVLLTDSQKIVKLSSTNSVQIAQEGLVVLKTFVDNLHRTRDYDRGIERIDSLLQQVATTSLSRDAAAELSQTLYQLARFLLRHKRVSQGKQRLWQVIQHYPDTPAHAKALALIVGYEKTQGMVYVAPGPLVLETQIKGAPSFIDPFFLDETPVTNLQYKAFIDQSGYPLPHHWSTDSYPLGKASHPVTEINYFDAQAFAEWFDKRLPSEFEWERAARSEDQRPYPWGAEFEPSRANTRASDLTQTTPVDAYPDGASNTGCLDMIGNVWEWTDSWYDGESRQRVLRGGSWFSYPEFATIGYRNFEIPKTRRLDFGFRCARSLEPA